MGGTGTADREDYRQTIQEALEKGIVPIGLSAAVSGIFLIVFFYLS